MYKYLNLRRPIELPLILIVDDDRLCRYLLKKVFEYECRLIFAESGAEAIQQTQSNSDICLILLDLVMPGMSGLETLKWLKANTKTQEIPVIFVTSSDNDESEHNALALGAIDYITKPIKKDIAKARIWNHINNQIDIEFLKIFNQIVTHCNEAIVVTDARKRIVYVNGAFSRISGYEKDETIGFNPAFLSSGHQGRSVYAEIWKDVLKNGYWSGELWNRKKNGEFYLQWIKLFSIANVNGIVTNYIGISSDITKLSEKESRVEHLAYYDALTGIPNRILLSDRIQQAIAHAERSSKILAVCYLDLDGFKYINDTIGYQGGDSILIEIAIRIKETIRSCDTVARMGGDEFSILLTELENEADCIASIERVIEKIKEPIVINGHSFHIGASIGYTIFPLDAENPDLLLRHANETMCRVKKLGKNYYKAFNPEIELTICQNNKKVQQIRNGIIQDEFEIYYQPKVILKTWELVGVEALIRWNHPELGLLYPDQFLPIIETNSLIVDLGDWVINQALKQINAWLMIGITIPISVNVSGMQIQDERFMQKLETALSNYPEVPSSLLELEVLESSALEIHQSAQVMHDVIENLGIEFSLDDFGTGYSSLIYLKSLPAKTLKIDRTFVVDMLNNQGDQAIIQGIIALARAFKHKTVAEGVETAAHAEALINMGCEVGQGYGIARPMKLDKFMTWYREFR